MTALADITKALAAMPPVEPGKARFIVVGCAAMRSLCCDVNGDKPRSLGNSIEQFPILETDEFPGWVIADKPVP